MAVIDNFIDAHILNKLGFVPQPSLHQRLNQYRVVTPNANTIMDEYTKQLKELKGKINVLSAIIRLGHEAFQKGNLDALASHILNNSRHIAAYDRACLADMRSKRSHIIAVMGQIQVNANSEYCIQVRNLLRSFHALKQPLSVNDETLKRNNASKKTSDAYIYFKETFPGQIYLIPMRAPRSKEPDSNLFLWMLEFKDNSQEAAQGLLFLLAQHYSEAIWSLLQRKSKISLAALKRRRRITPLKMSGLILIAFIVALIFVRTHQNIAADFELVPEKIFMQYAPFSGVLSESYFKNGDQIANDSVIIYDTAKLQFELADAQKKYDEISAELDLIRQESFSDTKQRGKIELLKIKQQKQKIDIRKINWYLSQSRIIAEYSGVLVIEEQEKLMGRSVDAGEKLFEIIRPGKPFAKIWLNEADAVVLREQPLKSNWITLYLHTRPETPISGKIISISPKPVLSETNQFCFIIRMALNAAAPNLTPDFIYGMRGVARVKGSEVSLGYYLFRNLILAWRKI